MSALNGIRAQARALLPGDCFLRRDQQLRALFATDFPRRHPDLANDVKKQLMQNGFDVTEEKDLWRLDLNRTAQLAFLQSLPLLPLPSVQEADLPLYSLCRSLLHQGLVPAEQQPWDAVRHVLLRLDAGEKERLTEELVALCALLKRKKMPLPTAAVSLLLSHE